MSIEFDLISDATREGYDLGKGPWEYLEEALRSNNPVASVTAMLIDHGFDLAYAGELASEITVFADKHPDWRIINDQDESDISVMTDEERAEELADMKADAAIFGDVDDGDEGLPIYKKIGSRYR